MQVFENFEHGSDRKGSLALPRKHASKCIYFKILLISKNSRRYLKEIFYYCFIKTSFIVHLYLFICIFFLSIHFLNTGAALFSLPVLCFCQYMNESTCIYRRNTLICFAGYLQINKNNYATYCIK